MSSAAMANDSTDTTVAITAPADEATLSQDDEVTLVGWANDANDGDLSANITWTSSLDGELGKGASVANVKLSVGTHSITAKVKDARGVETQKGVSVKVTAATATKVSVLSLGASYWQRLRPLLETKMPGDTITDKEICEASCIQVPTADNSNIPTLYEYREAAKPLRKKLREYFRDDRSLYVQRNKHDGCYVVCTPDRTKGKVDRSKDNMSRQLGYHLKVLIGQDPKLMTPEVSRDIENLARATAQELQLIKQHKRMIEKGITPPALPSSTVKDPGDDD